MAANISYNPWLTTTAQGSFYAPSTAGLIAGTAMDDPSSRNWLTSGIVASTETAPMYGGIAIYETIPTETYSSSQYGNPTMGGTLARATTVSAGAGQITGFTVFDQAFNGIITSSSNVPQYGTGATMNIYRLGTNARIAVACDPSLSSLLGGGINQQVSWDFKDQVLQPYDASTATYTITSLTPTYNNNGTWTIAVVMAAASPVGAVGDEIFISGVTGTGNAFINGEQTVVSFTDNQHFSFLVTAASGAISTLTGGVLNYGTGALNVEVLRVEVGNSFVPLYNPTTGVINWNRGGTCALIKL